MSLTAYNNVSVPSFMYGTAWKKEATTQLVQLAVATGFTAIDTANQLIHYQEALVGDALLALAQHGVPRDRLFLQTKFTPTNGQDHRTPYDASATLTTQVTQSFDSSLTHLHTDYLDSYVLHGPYQRQGLGAADWEVWAAIEGLYQSGKTKMIGISNVTAEQLTQLCHKAAVKPMVVQNRCYAALGGDKEVPGPGQHLSGLFTIDRQSGGLCRAGHSGHRPTVRHRSRTSRVSICDADRDAPLDRHDEPTTYERRSPS
jgi:diketogulonate reductase-like aldo/keto reductase